MAARDHLTEGESILSAFPPFFATTRRILRYEQKPGGDEVHELPYYQVATVEIVRRPRHTIALGGMVLAFFGVLLWGIGFYSSVPTVMFGVGIMLWGARGREAYYQFRSHAMTDQEQSRWQVKFQGSAGFIIAVRQHVRRPINW